MKDVIDKMANKGACRLLDNNVLLAAGLAITPSHYGSAVKAVLFLAFWLVGHAKFFLKIGTKKAVIILLMHSPNPFSIFGANNILMRAVFIAAFFIASLTSSAQYYYQDIVGTRELNDRMKALTAAKVKTIVAVGFDEQGVKTNDFSEKHEVLPDRTLKITTLNNRSISYTFYHFNENLELTSIRDSSGVVEVTSTYTYDASHRLASIKAVTNDSLKEFNATEEHQWKFNNAGKPEKMWRIVNGKDSFEYRFVLDSAGNVGEERQYRKGREVDFLYYYYNEKGEVTDVVRYNKTLMSLIPDMILTYDDSGHVIQKITPISYRNPNYLIWRYQFNEKGLKVKEALFNKNKERKGTIEYQYSFGS
jgi:hypothetical protein